MNPGIFLLGGGGDGGGSGSGKGKGTGGKQDGSGANGGNDADGGGNGANGCGGGGNGSCTNCGHRISAGHPVDVASGAAFTEPEIDVSLPGPLPLVVTRAYSTAQRELDVGLGFGWVHSLAVRVEERRRYVSVISGAGVVEVFEKPEVGETVLSRGGSSLERLSEGYRVEMGDDLQYDCTLRTADDAYLLSSVHDMSGNRVVLEYDGEQLIGVLDSAGRTVRVRRAPGGQIGALLVKNAASQGRWIAFATYEYDQNGDLVAVTDADGHTSRFRYDEEHQMLAHEDPTGLVFHFVYDDAGRAVETWGAPPGGHDPALSESAPALLADGRTPAKGIHHVRLDYLEAGYTEVTDSVQVRRFESTPDGTIEKATDGASVTTRTYDAFGNVSSMTDAEGSLSVFYRDRRGRLLSRVDPLGRRIEIERDGSGRMLAARDAAGNEWRIERDARGRVVRKISPRGSVFRYSYDERGLTTEEALPNGAVTRYSYDAQGNLIERVEPNGAVFRFGYDALGTLLSQVDSAGGSLRASYTDAGRPVAFFDATGAVAHFAYDGVGQLVGFSDRIGRSHRFVWGGYRRLCETHLPGGDVVRQKYDREGRLVEQINEKGEVHRRAYDLRGRVIEEQTSGGRVLKYARDGLGRTVRSIGGDDSFLQLTYNAAGQLVELATSDEAEERYGYSERGDLESIEGAGFSIAFERDAVGNIVRETQVVAGEPISIEHTYDLCDRRVARRTSRGHRLEQTLDGSGRPTRTVLDGGEETIVHDRDPLGRELVRHLSGGGHVGQTLDASGRVLRRWAGSGETARVWPGQPDWVGSMDAFLSATKDYDLSPAGDVLGVIDKVRGPTRYTYDLRGRLIEVLSGLQTPTIHHYDATGNRHEPAGPLSSYGPGDRLERRGDSSYSWDDDGHLTEKRVRLPDGREQVWRYRWAATGLLQEVRRDDDLRVQLLYDTFARRLAKQVFSIGTDGRETEVSFTRYVWDGGTLVHEIRRDASGESEQTYCYDDEDLAPICHRKRTAAAAEPWIHYLNDITGMPEELIGSDGRVIASIARTPWGRVDQGADVTPIRFAGQYEDPETGLHYNRHRYYDPDAGRYISADPIGVFGTHLNPYLYCENPIGWVDRLGLYHNARATLYRPNPAGGRDISEQVTGPTGSPDFNATHPDPHGHSEAHILEALEGRDDLEGTTLFISGDNHSCPACQERLENFARDNNMRIMYRKRNSRMTFVADFRPNGSGESNRTWYEGRRLAAVDFARGNRP
ncbi:MAG: RHS repeat-associated core domain-containing protein [Polyangiaceae bacterium]